MRLVLTLVVLTFPLADIFATRAFADATHVSAWWIFAVGAVLGFLVLRHERAHFRARFMAALTSASAHEPHRWRDVVDSGRKFAAGALLLFPGLLSDVAALTLMLIPINVASRLVPAWATSTQRKTAAQSANNRTIEGSYRQVD